MLTLTSFSPSPSHLLVRLLELMLIRLLLASAARASDKDGHWTWNNNLCHVTVTLPRHDAHDDHILSAMGSLDPLNNNITLQNL